MAFSYVNTAQTTDDYTFTTYEEMEAEAVLYVCETAEAIKLRNADMCEKDYYALAA